MATIGGTELGRCWACGSKQNMGLEHLPETLNAIRHIQTEPRVLGKLQGERIARSDRVVKESLGRGNW